MKPNVCRSCGAEIVWTVTDSGASMPLNPEPVEGGNIVFRPQVTLPGFGADPQVEYIAPADVTDPRPRYVSHFATCPDARSWSKR